MKKGLVLLVSILFALSAWAQDESSAASGNVDCAKNVSYFTVHAKTKNYLDAYTFWKKVYDACPSESKNIYIYGPEILRWKIDQAKTAEEKSALLEELLGVYDNRIKYFGDDPKIGKDYILGSKVQDYMTIMGNDTDFDKIYCWLSPVVSEMKENTDPYTLSQFVYASMARMIKNPDLKKQYIDDHMLVDGYYDTIINKAKEAGDDKRAETVALYKGDAQNFFAGSGAASCDMMQEIYGPQLADHKEDKAYLQNVLKVLRSVGCTESDVYITASEYMYKIEPSASAARGIATKAYKERNYDRAIKYFEEAISMSDDASERGDMYYMLAVINYDRNAYSSARNYANKAMQEKSGFGAPMLLIANMYAATARSIFPDDPIKQRIVYCLVVDKCERARAMDPSIAGEAGRAAAKYRAHYPNKEDVFMHPDLKEGSSFFVGGWIGESTTIRTN